MLDEPVERANRQAASQARRDRVLDGSIEWHPSRLCEALLDRLRDANSWPEALKALSETIGDVIGAVATPQGWLLDEPAGTLRALPLDRVTSNAALECDLRTAGWLKLPGLRCMEPGELAQEPMFHRMVGHSPANGHVLLMTMACDGLAPACLVWVLEDGTPPPSWIGRVLSEFAVGVPSWWRLLESLREARRQLESASRDRKVAMACRGLLHDLANAVFPIRCRLDLLFTPLKTVEEIRHLESISASIDQLEQLAFDLRREVDDEDDSAQPTVLSEWWAENRQVVAGALPPHVTLLESIPSAMPPIAMPESALTQVLVNLATNAGKAVGEDGVVIIAAREAGHRRIRLTVSDNGDGIDPEALERIRRQVRERRSEGLATSNGEVRRHGVGLAIVEELVERWGGRLEFESKVGEGTRIGVVVPTEAPDDGHAVEAIIEAEDTRRRWILAEMMRCLGVRATPREAAPSADDSVPAEGRASRDESDGMSSLDGGIELQASVRRQEAASLWIVEGPCADAGQLLEWLDAHPRRIAVAIGGDTPSHERLRVIEHAPDDPRTLDALRDVIASLASTR